MSSEAATPTSFISALLSCESAEYRDFNYGDSDIDALVFGAKSIILANAIALHQATELCHLDALLFAMLDSAPHHQGKQYVAVVLHVAHKHGSGTVVEVAKAWMNYLFLKFMLLLMKVESRPGSPASSIDNLDEELEDVTQKELRDLREKVAKREQHRCAISGRFDLDYYQRRGPPGKIASPMHATHIIPPIFSLFDNSENAGVRLTWAMFKAWTCIDVGKLTSPAINTPANAIYMSLNHHQHFSKFALFLEADPKTQNEYIAHTIMGLPLINGRSETTVVFKTPGAGKNAINPPDPELLRIHAAFAQVSHRSEIIVYVRSIARDPYDYGILDSDDEIDIELLFNAELGQCGDCRQ